MRRTATAAAVSAALALGLGGCSGDGIAAGGAGDEPAASGSINRSGLEPAGLSGEVSGEDEPGVRLEDRPQPTPGVVVVDGGRGRLTSLAIESFASRVPEVSVIQESSGEARAFERLCAGEVDVVDSTRPLDAEAHEQCRRNGFDVVQVQVAADAVVLAVSATTDTGTDCVTTDQLRAGLESGSAVTTWSQLGPDLAPLPFAAGGPSVADDSVRAAARTVLRRRDPLPTDLRADYAVAGSAGETLAFVAGSGDDAARDLAALQPRHDELKEALIAAWADWGVADAEVDAALRERPEDVRTARALRARALARVEAARDTFRPVDEVYRDLVERVDRPEDTRGRLGLFHLGFFQAHADLVRPLEVEGVGGDRGCVLPDTQTVLEGDYPLAHPLLLTMTTRAWQRPEVRQFLFDRLDRSQDLARQAGVVPLSDDEVARQVAWLVDGPPRFEVVDDGLTEVETDPATDTVPLPPVEVPAR